RRTPERLAQIAAARAPDPLTALLAIAPQDMTVFARDRSLSPDQAQAALAAARGTTVAGLALSPAHLDVLRTGITEHLTQFHEANPDLPGLGRERLRLALTPRLPKDAFLALLRLESDAGRITPDGAFLRLPGHEVRLSPEDEAIWDRIHPALLGDLRYRPPRVRDFATEFGADEKDIRRILRLTQKLGRTDQIAHDHFFAREVTAAMVAILRDVASQTPDGWFTAPLFRDRVQNGRKVAIEILDFFDRHGVTLRRGDLRRLNPHRLDLFGEA
ncbi:selenocysteine-specific translation factor, partial [Paracoccus liaowanqingii]